MSETESQGDGYSRRKLLLAAGSGLVAGLAGCSSSTGGNTASQPPSGSDSAPATRTETTTTAGESPQSPTATGKLQQQFDAVRSATSKYADVEAARRDGFVVLGPYMDGMGWHLLHQGRVAQAEAEGPTREKPALLTYVRTGDGLSLGSVEYAVPAQSLEGDPDLFADESADATERWSTHKAATHVFATPDNTQRNLESFDLETLLTNDNWAEFQPADEMLKPGETATLDWGSTEGKSGDRNMRTVDGIITHPDLRTLHAWLHEKNPEGVFTENNPRFAEHGGHHHGSEKKTGHHQ